MRTILRLVAFFLAVGVVVFWLFSGPNLGWYKTSVLHVEKDPVTELEKRTFEKRFVPGVDFLVLGVAVSGVIAGASFFFKRKNPAAAGSAGKN